MEVIGKIIIALPPVSGVSKTGNNWHKREYVLETMETYPRKIFFDFFNERADQYPLNVGDDIKLSFDIDSREYNGRWYVSVRGWKAEPANAAGPGVAQPYGAPQQYGTPQQGYAAPQQPYQAPQQPYQADPFAAPAPAQELPGAMPPPPAVGTPGATDDLPF